MTKAEMYDLIIVGGGPAGLTAGMYAMRAALKIVLIQQGAPGGQVAVTDQVDNYPGFIEIGGAGLCQKFLDHAKWYELEILTTGGTSRRLQIPGEDENFGSGVSYCADAHYIETRKA